MVGGGEIIVNILHAGASSHGNTIVSGLALLRNFVHLLTTPRQGSVSYNTKFNSLEIFTTSCVMKLQVGIILTVSLRLCQSCHFIGL